MPRPSKYKADYDQLAYDLCLLGITNDQLAAALSVNVDTLQAWQKKHSSFRESMQKGKQLADSQVAAALYKRAIGFSYDETTWERIEWKGDGIRPEESDIKTEAWKRKVVAKMVVPDTNAALQWLKNRQPLIWRDVDFSNLSDAQLDYIIEKLKKHAEK
jgi:hypothetical protein